MKFLMFLTIPLLLSACGQQYRYPCQDPSNWDKDICQKPLCEVNRDCPDHIFKPEAAKQGGFAPTTAPKKGECK